MGSTPIESTPAGVYSCGAHPLDVLNAPGNANYQGRAEGQRPDDAVYRVSTLDVKWVQQKHRSFSLSVDGSVREPMKGVPSCDKLREGAGSL